MEKNNEHVDSANNIDNVPQNPFEYNVFWAHLLRIVSDFQSDVEQIRLMLKNADVQMPWGYDESLENPPQVFCDAYNYVKDKGEDDIAYLLADDQQPYPVSKKLLRFFIETTNTVRLKNARNRNFLNIMCFTHLVSLFDAAMQDFASALFNKYPFAMVPLDKGATVPSMNYIDILNARSVEQLKDEIIQRELLSFGFKSIKDQLSYFNKILNRQFIDMKAQHVSIGVDDNIIGSIIEIRETRNIHVHNKGVVNRLYSQKLCEFYDVINKNKKDGEKKYYTSPDANNYTNGDFKEITERYLQDAIWKCEHLLIAIKDDMADKFISKDEQSDLMKANQEYWRKRSEVKNKTLLDEKELDNNND
ncbi:hypothetical protein [Hymenobacter sublimis]|uniref:Uncharacterized protein n=1 Tax=Hymenobacter sublimis TaxID=2933777 RepID=A0ABY4JCL9_9BACT|nr:hypothetical protein [Hymenobacter sublimis]UPL50556.1 hypothetical protein MWH26_06515 [Hymenobacter sublimis]